MTSSADPVGECYDTCAGIPGIGARACLEDCLASIGAPPPPPVGSCAGWGLPCLNVGDITGAGKWLVVGLVAIAIISVTRVFR